MSAPRCYRVLIHFLSGITAKKNVTLVRFRDYLKPDSVIPVSEDGTTPHLNMKKFKNLRKRIRRLESRLQKGATKLARLKRKLEAAETAAAAKARRKSAAPAKKAGKASVAESGAVKKVKRKLNLTPERRAQLAASMKARWAAKRAAAAPSVQPSPSGPDSAPGGASQPQ